ncbi:HBL/NHE enterotoxin family protein [Pseudomonas sp. NPDC090233]|uniref:HBL/NHE enterotoxin family protein n=1 Tax=Pseudomonas sp. NPDC090233 TaxID=3364479 RepID=UPI00383A3BF7
MTNVQQLRPLFTNSILLTDDHNDAINQTASAGSLVNGACTAILQQANMDVPAMPEMAKHQQTARDHANLWINTLQPALIGSIGGVVGFSNQFNAYLAPLLKAAANVNTDPKARQTVVEGLQLLQTAANTQKSNAVLANQSVDDFRKNFSVDFSAFATDIDTLTQKLAGDNGEIIQLQAEMAARQKAMNNDLTMIAAGATGAVVGVLMIAVGVLAEIPSAGLSTGLIVAGGVVVAGGAAVTIYGSVDYSSNMKKYKAAAEKLAADQAEIVLMTHAKGQLGTLNQQISNAIGALNAMESSWQTLISSLDTLIKQVQSTDVDSAFLTAQLNAACSDWDDMATQARKVQDMINPAPVPLSVVENIPTPAAA